MFYKSNVIKSASNKELAYILTVLPTEIGRTLAQIGAVSIKTNATIQTGTSQALVDVNFTQSSRVTGTAAVAVKVVQFVGANPTV